MVKSMFAAIAGLQTHQSKMDVISNNIANVNTWGYKTRSANFQDSMYQNVVTSAAGTTIEGGTGGVNSSQLGYGVNMSSISTNYTTGSRGYTGDGYNAMIDGTGFFIVGPMKTTDVATNGLKEAGLSLSRVGILSVDGNGYIVDNLGNYVYGLNVTAQPAAGGLPTYSSGDATNPPDAIQAIRIPNVGTSGTRYDLSSIQIGQDGVITGVESSTGALISVGKIMVASVENVNGLEQDAGYLYDIGANAGVVSAIETNPNTTGKILNGYLEMSNVDLATEMANMITTQRGYQANSKIITVTDEMLEQLVNMV